MDKGMKSVPGEPAAASPEEGGIDLGRLPRLVGYAIRRTQIAVFQDFYRTLTPVDLRPAEFSVLLVMDRNPGLRQRQIGDALGIQPSNLAVLMGRLVERGLVQRQANARDRRSVTLRLTNAGQALLADACALVDQHDRQITAGLSAVERRQLFDLLARLMPLGAAGD